MIPTWTSRRQPRPCHWIRAVSRRLVPTKGERRPPNWVWGASASRAGALLRLAHRAASASRPFGWRSLAQEEEYRTPRRGSHSRVSPSATAMLTLLRLASGCQRQPAM